MFFKMENLIILDICLESSLKVFTSKKPYNILTFHILRHHFKDEVEN